MSTDHRSQDESIHRAVSAGGSRVASARGSHSLPVLVALALSLLGCGLARSSEGVPSREYQLKAAFVYNFTKFIEWPPRSFSAANAPLVIGVLGETPLASELEQLVRDRKVNGHAILLKRIHSAADAASTHLMFVSPTEDSQFASWRTEIESRPIVTVGESASFAQNGGTINFILQDDKVRFEISTAFVERSGLRISAQLQKLAASVRKAAP